MFNRNVSMIESDASAKQGSIARISFCSFPGLGCSGVEAAMSVGSRRWWGLGEGQRPLSQPAML